MVSCSCGVVAQAGEAFCTACGARLSDSGQSTRRWIGRPLARRYLIAALLGLVLTAALSAVGLASGIGAERAPARNVMVTPTGLFTP